MARRYESGGEITFQGVRSAPVEAHDLGLGQRVEMELKSDDGCRGVGRHLETVGPNCEYREQITVRVIARRRARSAIPGGAEVGAGLQRALRQLRSLRIASIQLKLRDIGRDVHHQPVPEAAARGRVRIETSHAEALRAGRGSRPGQMRRLIVALAAEAKFGRKNVGVGQIITVLEIVASHRERHALSPVCTLLTRPKRRDLVADCILCRNLQRHIREFSCKGTEWPSYGPAESLGTPRAGASPTEKSSAHLA